jgi:hypothetical protein
MRRPGPAAAAHRHQDLFVGFSHLDLLHQVGHLLALLCDGGLVRQHQPRQVRVLVLELERLCHGIHLLKLPQLVLHKGRWGPGV